MSRKQKWNENQKREVKFHMSSTAQHNNNDVNGKRKEHGIKPKETKRQSDLPLVAILHDTVLSGCRAKYWVDPVSSNLFQKPQ